MVKFKTRDWSRVLKIEPRGKIGFLVFSREFPSFYPYFFESSVGFLEAPCSELITRGTTPLLVLGILAQFAGRWGRCCQGAEYTHSRYSDAGQFDHDPLLGRY